MTGFGPLIEEMCGHLNSIVIIYTHNSFVQFGQLTWYSNLELMFYFCSYIYYAIDYFNSIGEIKLQAFWNCKVDKADR